LNGGIGETPSSLTLAAGASIDEEEWKDERE